MDVGTQSVRVMAFDARGRVVDGVRLEYDRPYDSPRPGWAEQDADHYLIKMGEACRMMWSRGRVAPESLSGLCLTSQRSTVIYLDRAGKPLRPAILWLDQRRAGRLPRLPLHWRLLFGLTGLSPTLHQLMAEAETNWVREKQPEILERAEHICFLSAYLNYKLTGQMADSVANQVGYLPFDYKRFRWCSPSAWKSAAVPGVLDKMVELVPPGERLGQITAQASSLTGLPKGLAVIAGASDKACEVLGAGCLEPDQGCIGLGTTATINVNSAKYIEPIPLVPPYPSAKRGEYNLEVQTFRGFWLVTWFKEQFGQIEVATAREKGIPAEVLLDEIAARTPPGALGLSLQPYWTPGVRFPGPEAKGAIIGFGSAHGKGHLYRAILEGLAFSLRFGRERIERKTGVRMTSLTACGGGSQSDLMMQIAADVFGLETARPSLDEASALGAAVLAAAGAGLHPGPAQAASAMTGQGRVFRPRPEAAELYDGLYRKVHRPMYRRLRPAYRAIMELTGYPEKPGNG